MALINASIKTTHLDKVLWLRLYLISALMLALLSVSSEGIQGQNTMAHFGLNNNLNVDNDNVVGTPTATQSGLSSSSNSECEGTYHMYCSGSNDYLQILINTTGYYGITISWQQRNYDATNGKWNFAGDYNNDGTFDYTETNNPIVTTNCATVTITLLPNFDNQSNVRLRLTSNLTGGSNFYLDDITIRGYVPPVANFSANTTLLAETGSANFSDLSTNTPGSWNWSFPGGTPSSSTSQNPSVTYNTAGVYDVSLTVTNPAGSDNETKTGYITVYDPLNVYSTAQTNTTVSVPVCAATVTVLAWGAGAGGTNAGGSGRGGGGGGAFTRGTISSLTQGSSISVTVGDGGTAGTPTTAPGNYSNVTYNASNIQANGGLSYANSNTGGPGGTAQTVTGIIEAAYAGGNGGNGSTFTSSDAGGGGGGSAFINNTGGNGGNGGNSSFTGGAGGNGTGNGGNGAASDNSPAPQTGNAPGGGGGGRGEYGGTSASGADGRVIIVWNNGPTPGLSTKTVTALITPVCFSPSSQTATMNYTASTGNPVSYSIDWSSGPTDQGVTTFAFAPGGGIINNIAISANVPAGNYSGTMTLYTSYGCTGTITVALNVMPAVSLSNSITNEMCPADNNGMIDIILSGGLSGVRYIKVTQQKADWTNLAELQAFEVFTGTNVALNAAVTVSSVYGPSFPAVNFTDGNFTNAWHSNNTNIGEYAKVDLGSAKNIDYIRIYNRDDCCQDRSDNLMLELFDASNVLMYSKNIDVYEGVNGPHYLDINILDLSWSDAGSGLSRTWLSSGTYTFNYADGASCFTGNTQAVITADYAESTAPTSITGDNILCHGESTTLSTNGGSLGTEAKDIWYAGGCAMPAFNQDWTIQPYSTYTTTVNSNSDGILNVTSTSGDPMIYMTNTGSYNTSVYKYILIGYRVVSGPATGVEIYYTKNGGSDLSESQSVRTDLINDNNWHVVSLDMSASANWTGNITGWRYDWSTANGVTMDLDFIILSNRPIVGVGPTITVSPETSTIYYTHKKGFCNITLCASQMVTVNELPGFTATYTNLSCFNEGNGTITITPSGGSGDGYLSRLNDGSGWTDWLSQLIWDNLDAKTYTIEVKDSNDCIQINGTVINP